MFEGFLAVPLHFTIEFLGFLVTAGGAVLAFSRPSLVPGPTSNRVAASLGLVALAAAQVMHGGAFVEIDGDELVVAIRALGFALLLIGIVGDLKPAAAAVLGFEIEQPLLFVPAGAALLMSLAAASAARRAHTRFYGRLALAGLFLAASEAATASMLGNEIIGGGSVNRFTLIAHGLKFLGYIFLGAWLWSAVRSSIRTRFVASFGALLVAVILALSTALTGVIANNVETEELERVRNQAVNAAAAYSIRGDEVKALNTKVSGIVSETDLSKRLARNVGPRVLARKVHENRLLVDPEKDDFVIVDPELTGAGAIGTGAHVFNRAGIPKPRRLKRADVVSIMGSSVVRSVVQGAIERSAGPAEIGDHVAFLAAHSVMSDEGKRLGILVLGRWVDALEIEAIEQSVGAPVTIFSGKVLDVTTLPRSAARELRVGPAIRDDLRTSPGVSDQLALGSSSYFAGYAGITDGRGQVVGTIVVSPQSRLVVDTRNPVTRILFLAAMLVGAVALLLAYFSGKRITRPIQVLTSAAGAVREGDLSARAEVEGEDEVGQLGETFNEMTQSLMRFTDDLRTAARQEHDLRERIETIISSMADGLVAVDADLNILAFNPEAERITGVPAEEAAGRPFPSVVHAQGLQGEAVELPMSSLSEGLSANVFVKPRDGDRVPVAVTSAVLRDEEDEITGGVTVIRDMTREREIERMKTEFLSNISHELRTPLTPIKGYAEILGRKEVPFDKVKQFVGGILDSTVRLERIVELLVDYSALEAGRLAARAGQVDICEMLRSLATKWEARVPTHQLVVELPEDVSLEVVGDERLLRRSLEEVLDNAVKFSPDGGTVRLSARPAAGGNGSADAGMVEVSVTDQGIGIPPEDLPKIFTDFQQLDGSETRTYGGLGLGLAFVQRIVEAHKGSLRVESEPEAGTRLTISIPSAGQLLEQVEQIKD